MKERCSQVLLGLWLAALGCLASASDRDEFGLSGLSIWSPLTEFEQFALEVAPEAHRGEPDALLAWYLVASGDTRDFATYDLYRERINQWLLESGIEPGAISPSRHGRHLLLTMHESFFGTALDEYGLPASYSIDQSKLSHILSDGEFNCISSAMLYIVLARKVGLEVDGVVLPSHAFVQLKDEEGRIIDIETTHLGGFDQLHDEAFYETGDNRFFVERGLTVPTYQDYLRREVVAPLDLALFNMINQHTGEDRMAYLDRMRLAELRGHLLYQDMEAQKTRLAYYYREYARFSERGDYRNAGRMFEVLSPYLQEVEQHLNYDSQLHGLLTGVQGQMAETWIHSGREEAGLRLARQLLYDRKLDQPAELSLEDYLFSVLGRYAVLMAHGKQFQRARGAYAGLEERCLERQFCRARLAQVYSQWAMHRVASEDWQGTVEIYQDYLLLDQEGPLVKEASLNMEKAYLNWANREEWDGEWEAAMALLDQCVQTLKSPELCQSAQADFERRYDEGLL